MVDGDGAAGDGVLQHLFARDGVPVEVHLVRAREREVGEVLAVVGDVGQDRAELVGIEEKAHASGAVACEVIDLREEFLEDFLFAYGTVADAEEA